MDINFSFLAAVINIIISLDRIIFLAPMLIIILLNSRGNEYHIILYYSILLGNIYNMIKMNYNYPTIVDNYH